MGAKTDSTWRGQRRSPKPGAYALFDSRAHGTVRFMPSAYAVLATVSNKPGILFGLTKVLADHQANITYVDIIPHPDRDPEVNFEFSVETPVETVIAELRHVPGVSKVELTPSFSKIYGKRIVIM